MFSFDHTTNGSLNMLAVRSLRHWHADSCVPETKSNLSLMNRQAGPRWWRTIRICVLHVQSGRGAVRTDAFQLGLVFGQQRDDPVDLLLRWRHFFHRHIRLVRHAQAPLTPWSWTRVNNHRKLQNKVYMKRDIVWWAKWGVHVSLGVWVSYCMWVFLMCITT